MAKKSSKRRNKMLHDMRISSHSQAPVRVEQQSSQGDSFFSQALEFFDAADARKDDSEQNKQKNSGRTGDKSLISIDLHGMTLSEAQDHVYRVMSRHLGESPRSELRFRIITGKGVHSGHGGGILAKEMHAYVSQRFSSMIIKIDSSPHEVAVSGLPIRGHFDVVLKSR
jgi:DNA-nicking Smr family endonuclease